MRTSRLTAAVLLAAGVLFGTASPAAANVAVVEPTVDAGGSDLRPISATGSGIVLSRNANGTRNVTYNCSAVGAGDIVAITVSCAFRVNGVTADSVQTTLPGAGAAASAAANAVFSARSGFYEVCYSAVGYYVNGQQKPVDLRCKPIVPLV